MRSCFHRRQFLRAHSFADDYGDLPRQRSVRSVSLGSLFNPVPVMKLVEVVRTIATDACSMKRWWRYRSEAGTTAVRGARQPRGFIVNSAAGAVFAGRDFARWKKAPAP